MYIFSVVYKLYLHMYVYIVLYDQCVLSVLQRLFL